MLKLSSIYFHLNLLVPTWNLMSRDTLSHRCPANIAAIW